MGEQEIRTAVGRWIDIRKRANKDEPTSADADHSALLGWLLSGREPLEYPPPRGFSYPDYDLALGHEKRVTHPQCFDIGFYDSIEPWVDSAKHPTPQSRYVLMQQSLWEIVARDGDDLIVQFHGHGEKWRDPRPYTLIRKSDGQWYLQLAAAVPREGE